MVLGGLLFRWINEAISPFKVESSFRVAVLVGFYPLMRRLLSGNFEAAVTGIIIQICILYVVLYSVKIMVSSRF